MFSFSTLNSFRLLLLFPLALLMPEDDSCPMSLVKPSNVLCVSSSLPSEHQQGHFISMLSTTMPLQNLSRTHSNFIPQFNWSQSTRIEPFYPLTAPSPQDDSFGVNITSCWKVLQLAETCFNALNCSTPPLTSCRCLLFPFPSIFYHFWGCTLVQQQHLQLTATHLFHHKQLTFQQHVVALSLSSSAAQIYKMEMQRHAADCTYKHTYRGNSAGGIDPCS